MRIKALLLQGEDICRSEFCAKIVLDNGTNAFVRISEGISALKRGNLNRQLLYSDN